MMQTLDVVKNIGLGMYLYGKILQCSLSMLLSVLSHGMLFQKKLKSEAIFLISIVSIIMIIGCLLLLKRNNSSIVKKNNV